MINIIILLLMLLLATLGQDYFQPTPFSAHNRILSVVLAFDLGHFESLGHVLRQYVSLCEAGWQPTVTLLTTVPVWEKNVTDYLGEKFYCARINSSINLKFSIHDRSVGVHLSVKQREYIAQNVDAYDLFVYQEDDMILTPSNLVAYLQESHFIHEAPTTEAKSLDHRYMVGFIRYTKRILKDQNLFDASSILNHDMLVEGSLAFEHICVGGAPYLEVHWNTHQALWILTKWQLQMLQNKCNFLHEYGGGVKAKIIREFMSSFSIFKNHLGARCTCCLDKLLPGRNLLSFLVYHFYDSETSRETTDGVFHSAIQLTTGSIRVGENPPNAIVSERLRKAPCWRDLFINTRATHNLPPLNATERFEIPYPDGTLIRFHDSKQVYVMLEGTKRLIPSRVVFQQHGFDFEDVKVVTDATLFSLIDNGPDLS